MLHDAVLYGAVINKEKSLILVNQLEAEHFLTVRQRAVFNSIKKLVESGQEVNTFSIIEEQPTDLKRDVTEYLVDTKLPVINFDQCIKQIKKQYHKNLLKAGASELVEIIKRNNGDVSEIMEKLYSVHIDMTRTEKESVKAVDKFAEIGYQHLFHDLKYISSGLTGLDDIINGFTGGQLVTIAARPGNGKSALAAQIANKIGTNCLFYSLEMKARDMYARLLSSMTGVEIKYIMSRNVTPIQADKLAEAEKELKNNKLEFIDNKNGLKEIMLDIRNKCLTAEIKCIMIDYVQIIRVAGNEPRHIQIGKITKELKQTAMEFEVPIIIMAQVGRGYEKEERPPRLSDLRESGDIENDSDMVIFIHAKESKNDEPPVEIIVAKNRNGKTGFFDAIFKKKRFKFLTDVG